MNMQVMALLAAREASQDDLANHVAHLVCSNVADSCAIAILSDDGRTLHPLGLFDRRSDVMAQLEGQSEMYWQPRGGTSEQALESGEPVLLTELNPETVARGRPLAARLLTMLQTDSGIVAPMRAAGTRLGVVAVGRTRHRDPFGEEDVPYIQSLADKVALGLANARLRERVAREQHPPTLPGAEDPADGLTDREREVLRLIGDGLTNREIGEQLYLSVRTVEWHRSNLSAKLGVTRRSELIAAGRRLGP
jgi:DNA-binding CsgD family transcriptional regulator